MPENVLSGYQMMWVLVMFDLPVGTKKEMKAATKFRQGLLDIGFEMDQFSVYMRFCNGKDQYNTLVNYVKSFLPPSGSVEIYAMTDKQYENAVRFVGRKTEKKRKNPDQLAFF